MKNRELINRIRSGAATPGQFRLYADRVARRRDPDCCEHGHYGCALMAWGPCSDECLGAAERPTAQRDGEV